MISVRIILTRTYNIPFSPCLIRWLSSIRYSLVIFCTLLNFALFFWFLRSAFRLNTRQGWTSFQFWLTKKNFRVPSAAIYAFIFWTEFPEPDTNSDNFRSNINCLLRCGIGTMFCLLLLDTSKYQKGEIFVWRIFEECVWSRWSWVISNNYNEENWQILNLQVCIAFFCSTISNLLSVQFHSILSSNVEESDRYEIYKYQFVEYLSFFYCCNFVSN